MRILALVTDAFGGHGGIAKFNRDLLSALCRDDKVEKVIAVPRLVAEPPDKLPEKLEFVMSAAGGKLRFALTVLRCALRRPRAELILCGHINLLPVALVARWLCGAPVVLVIHGIDAWQPTRSRIVNRLVRKIDAFISVSEFTRRRFLEWARLADVKSFILPNCIDLTQFAPGPKNPELLKRYGLSGRTVLLTVARLSSQERYKGIDEVLEALPDLAKQIPNLSYLIVGDGADRSRLEQKAASLALRERVVFAGRMDEAEKVEHYRLADAFVMAGWGEGFGIVYLEALACGIPAVASTLDASQEAVLNGKMGVLANPKDRADLSSGILRALNWHPRGVPEDLKVFDQEHFVQRCQAMLSAMREPGTVTSG